ncbi:DUF805 domain-containing protein [Peloplasma aerotolerans]|uniref:DUF805 domain-containing protein n=1 Tax=Peloplasma aerotolerans TaxID=3044389 RepID=A0AAW6U8R8_9MOLU|nr:DUF805 domain-containing protein [Mariniplasma sp. M4Ah]MDI6452344.1 DUF805 domain-containing protein [Mariniplasma sp. M4Ah]
MICEKCKSVINDGSIECPHCGYMHDSNTKSQNHGDTSLRERRLRAFTRYPKRYPYKGKRGFSAITHLYKESFNFSGESDLKEYLTQQFYIMFLFAAFAIPGKFFLDSPSSFPRIGIVILIILFILIVISSFSSLSATQRRLRNAGYPKNTYFLSYIPVLGGIILLLMTFAPAE